MWNRFQDILLIVWTKIQNKNKNMIRVDLDFTVTENKKNAWTPTTDIHDLINILLKMELNNPLQILIISHTVLYIL